MNYMYLQQVPPNKVLRLTKSGLDGLKQRLDTLRAERNKVYGHVRSAVSERQDADDPLTMQKIKDLERDDQELYKILQVLEYATVVSIEADRSSIDIGSTVVLRNERAETCEYTVVCPLEVNLEINKISDESPLGKLMVGKKVGDTFNVTSRKGDTLKFTIEQINNEM